MTTDLLPSSTKLFGYDVIEPIGEGAGSVIYAVTDPSSKQIYALKYVARNEEKDIRFIEQLETEYEVGRQVNHVGLRRAIDLKVERTLLRRVTSAALILELFDGRPLESIPPQPLLDLVAIFIKTAQALEHLNAQGYIHCDLKPNNILVNSQQEVKVIDLGQACKAGTVKQRIQGTPDFIAPEQVRCQPLSIRTDVFNFGATLYWALCGQKLPTLYTLKKGDNSFLVDDAIKVPMELNPHVPETLSNFVMDCVRTNPARRPADFQEVASRLEIIHHSISFHQNPPARLPDEIEV